MMAYFNILRPINLTIVVVTQTIIYFLVLSPQIPVPAINHFQYLLLTLCTAIIAGSGYLINDIYDIDTDQINKPDKSWIPRQISLKKAWRYYFFLIGAGFLIAIYLALKTSNLPLLSLYPLSIVLLWRYASKLKKAGISGNLVVAFMTSFVTIILIIAERRSLMQAPFHHLLYLLIGFAYFSFLVNLAREWVKDIEDMEGDLLIGSSSLPIKAGISSTKKWINSILVISMLSVFIFQFLYAHTFHQHIFAMVFILAPMAKAAIKLSNGREKADFHKTANFLKLILFAGMIYLLLFSPFFNDYGNTQ